MTETLIVEMLMAERLLAESVIGRGTVKRFDAKQGYGFISADEGDEDLLVRSTSVRGQLVETLTEGTRVEFEVREGERGLEAFGVVPIEERRG